MDVDEVRESISEHGGRYLSRVFTERELSDCRRGDGFDPARLAARFAAKEAALKSLGVGDNAVSWKDVEVERDQTGAVSLSLHNRAFKLAEASRVNGLAVSLTHERGIAGAVVVAEISQAVDT